MLWRAEDEWIDFYEAVTEVERRLGCPREVAKERLRAASAEGRIYTMKAPFEQYEHNGQMLPFEEWTAVPSSDWRKRKMDHDGPDHVGYQTLIMLNKGTVR
jgi:hypothetical protein